METNVVLLNLSIGWQKLPKENIALDGEFVFMGAPVYAPCSPFRLALKFAGGAPEFSIYIMFFMA